MTSAGSVHFAAYEAEYEAVLARARHAVARMVVNEQANPKLAPRMSSVMWDMFTGSATYREILLRTLHPVFLIRFFTSFLASIFGRSREPGATATNAALVTAGVETEQR